MNSHICCFVSPFVSASSFWSWIGGDLKSTPSSRRNDNLVPLRIYPLFIFHITLRSDSGRPQHLHLSRYSTVEYPPPGILKTLWMYFQSRTGKYIVLNYKMLLVLDSVSGLPDFSVLQCQKVYVIHQLIRYTGFINWAEY